MPDLPAPLVPAGVDLRHYACMSLDVKRLRDSRFTATVSGEGFRCGLLLWAAAWHQVPAGSLPGDDVELCALAGFGRAVAQWREHRADALYGWVECSDGRLYHPVVAEKAIDAWNTTLFHRWRKEVDRIRKENKGREERRLPPLETPAKPLEIRVGTSTSSGRAERMDGHGEGGLGPEAPGPTADAGPGEAESASPQPIPAETENRSNGNPAENALNGTERNVISISCPKRAAPARTRRPYPQDFERFWSAYPTDPIMSKSKTGDAWTRLADDDRAAALAAAARFAAYCRGKPDYRPVHAVRFLTDRRFDGFGPAPADMASRSEPLSDVFEVRGRQIAEENIVAAIERWRRAEGWPPAWGPPPDDPACRIPRSIVDRANAGTVPTPSSTPHHQRQEGAQR